MTVSAAAVMLALLGVAAWHDAPWFIWAIWGTATGATLWLVIADPRRLFWIDDTSLGAQTGRTRLVVPLEDIAFASVTKWSDGPDTCVIEKRDGTRTLLPAETLPPADALEAEFSARGVNIERR